MKTASRPSHIQLKRLDPSLPITHFDDKWKCPPYCSRLGDFQWISEVFLCPLAQILIPQIPPTQKGKEVMEGTLYSPVAAAEKEILSGAGQKISLGWNTMGRKCDANLAEAGLQRVTPHLCL